jgi:hypothetical protein
MDIPPNMLRFNQGFRFEFSESPFRNLGKSEGAYEKLYRRSIPNQKTDIRSVPGLAGSRVR